MRYRRILWVPALAAALVLTGCASSDGDSESVGGTTATQAAPQSESAEEKAERVAEEQRKAEEEAAAKAAEADAAKKKAEEEAAAKAAEDARAGTVSQQNAYRSAQSYLEMAGFSRAGLLNQLTSEYGEGYPLADAEFAIARLEAEGGVDWSGEAVQSARSYLDMTGFSRAGLIDQLTSEYGEGFTREQAEYAADQVGL